MYVRTIVLQKRKINDCSLSAGQWYCFSVDLQDNCPADLTHLEMIVLTSSSYFLLALSSVIGSRDFCSRSAGQLSCRISTTTMVRILRIKNNYKKQVARWNLLISFMYVCMYYLTYYCTHTVRKMTYWICAKLWSSQQNCR